VLAPGGAGGQLLGGLPLPVDLQGGDHGWQEHGGSAAGDTFRVVLGWRAVEGVEAALDPEVPALQVEVGPFETE
jgi:hypothetical protein